MVNVNERRNSRKFLKLVWRKECLVSETFCTVDIITAVGWKPKDNVSIFFQIKKSFKLKQRTKFALSITVDDSS